MNEDETLATALPAEQKRVRELIPIYESIGPPGYLVAGLCKAALDKAERASAAGDVAGMIAALKQLRGIKE